MSRGRPPGRRRPRRDRDRPAPAPRRDAAEAGTRPGRPRPRPSRRWRRTDPSSTPNGTIAAAPTIPAHCRVIAEPRHDRGRGLEPGRGRAPPHPPGAPAVRGAAAAPPDPARASRMGRSSTSPPWCAPWPTARAGLPGSDRVYSSARAVQRDLAVAVLVDVSLSTDSWVDGPARAGRREGGAAGAGRRPRCLRRRARDLHLHLAPARAGLGAHGQGLRRAAGCRRRSAASRR